MFCVCEMRRAMFCVCEMRRAGEFIVIKDTSEIGVLKQSATVIDVF
jgi:hypothetical protein